MVFKCFQVNVYTVMFKKQMFSKHSLYKCFYWKCLLKIYKITQESRFDWKCFFFFFFTFNILFIHPFFTSVQKNLGGREWQTLHQIYLQVQCIAKTTRSTFLLFYILLNRKITTDFFCNCITPQGLLCDRKMK